MNRQRSNPIPERIEFFESLDFGALMPEAYERYRLAIVDALVFFLENLSADRAMDILAQQALMPPSSAVGERLVAIARHCPVLHKLGQVLAATGGCPGLPAAVAASCRSPGATARRAGRNVYLRINTAAMIGCPDSPPSRI